VEDELYDIEDYKNLDEFMAKSYAYEPFILILEEKIDIGGEKRQ